MKNIKFTRIPIVILAATVCVAIYHTDAHSQGNLHLGSLKIHPKFVESITYIDNAFRVSGKGKNGSKNSDTYINSAPSIDLALPFGGGSSGERKHTVGLKWNSDFINYRHNADLNQQNHYVTALAEFHFPRGFDIALHDTYDDTWELAGSETDQLHPRRTNAGEVKVSLPDYFGRFDVDLTYSNFDQDYDERALRRANRNENYFTISIPFKLTPKVTLFPEYTYGMSTIEKERAEGDDLTLGFLSDSHSHTAYGGISWQATAKTTGTVKVGFTNVDYERAEAVDIKTFVASLGIAVDISKRTKLAINGGRDSQVSEFTFGSNGYVRSYGSLNLMHKIKKLTASISADTSKSVFRDSTRRDDSYKLGAKLKYDVNKWSFADFDYSYKDRHSNDEDQSDRINTVTLGVGIYF